MIDENFGPWSSSPTQNRWEEFKIGQIEKWYSIISSSLNINPSAANSLISPTTAKYEASRIPQHQKLSSQKQSKIPKPQIKPPSKRSQNHSPTASRAVQQQMQVQQQSPSHSNQASPRTTASEIGEQTPALFNSVKVEKRDEFDPPRTFDSYLASPNFLLQGWPVKFVPFDEVVGKAMNPPKAQQNNDKQARMKRKIPKRA